MKSSTLQFLKTLEKNNNRDWFNDNKKDYLYAKEDVESFIENLIEEIAKFDEEILKMDPKKALFRIYKDIRFSKLKIPYKTHFGAALGFGKGSKISGYYIQIEPGKSFLAGGVYQPESSVLKEIRNEISMNSVEFSNILDQEDFRNNFRGLSVESKLQRVPAGFEKDHPMAEYLKLKNLIVNYPLSDDQILGSNAPIEFAQIFKSMKPLNDFIEKSFH